MGDYMTTIIAGEAGLRGYVCMTTELANEAQRRHRTAPTPTIALGRALTAVALIGGTLKVRQRVAMRWEGSGPLEKIVVEAESNGRVRGYVAAPDLDMPLVNGDADLVAAIGRAGLLTVIKDLKLKNLVEGVVHLAASDIDTDVVYFLEQSEQIPSILATGLALDEEGKVTTAGGLLLQPLPPYDPAIIDQIKERLQEMPPLTDMLRDGRKIEAILDELLRGIRHEFLSRFGLKFECDCSWERTRRALAALGPEEVENLLRTEGEAVITCRYCGERYVYDREALEVLLAEMAGGASESASSES